MEGEDEVARPGPSGAQAPWSRQRPVLDQPSVHSQGQAECHLPGGSADSNPSSGAMWPGPGCPSAEARSESLYDEATVPTSHALCRVPGAHRLTFDD